MSDETPAGTPDGDDPNPEDAPEIVMRVTGAEALQETSAAAAERMRKALPDMTGVVAISEAMKAQRAAAQQIAEKLNWAGARAALFQWNDAQLASQRAMMDGVRLAIGKSFMSAQPRLGLDLAKKMQGLQADASRALVGLSPSIKMMPVSGLAPAPLRRFVPPVPDPSAALRRIEEKVDRLIEIGLRLLGENARTGVKESFLELRDFIMMIAQGISDERWRKESEN